MYYILEVTCPTLAIVYKPKSDKMVLYVFPSISAFPGAR